MELPFDAAVPLLGTYPKNPEIPVQKNICTLMCIAVLFTVAKIWKEARCPSADEWVKNWYVYIVEYYVAIKKKKLLPSVSAWMDLEIITLSEISQSEKDKYHIISRTCGI